MDDQQLGTTGLYVAIRLASTSAVVGCCADTRSVGAPSGPAAAARA